MVARSPAPSEGREREGEGDQEKEGEGEGEREGRAILRIDGKRYERQLVRIRSGDILDGITKAITDHYPSRTTRAGDCW